MPLLNASIVAYKRISVGFASSFLSSSSEQSKTFIESPAACSVTDVFFCRASGKEGYTDRHNLTD